MMKKCIRFHKSIQVYRNIKSVRIFRNYEIEVINFLEKCFLDDLLFNYRLKTGAYWQSKAGQFARGSMAVFGGW